jgi:putative molybdopterin biosynthesis protein
MTQAPQPVEREKDFYTTQELADLWELKPVTIYRLVERGELPAYTIGKSKRYKKSDVDAYLASRRSVAPHAET